MTRPEQQPGGPVAADAVETLPTQAICGVHRRPRIRVGDA